MLYISLHVQLDLPVSYIFLSFSAITVSIVRANSIAFTSIIDGIGKLATFSYTSIGGCPLHTLLDTLNFNTGALDIELPYLLPTLIPRITSPSLLTKATNGDNSRGEC